MQENRRSFLRTLGTSALALGAASVPAVASATLRRASGLPTFSDALHARLRSALQLLAIALQSLEELAETPEIISDPEYFSVDRTNDIFFAVRTHERALLALGFTAEGPMTSAVAAVRDYQHRYLCNAKGQERATLAMKMAADELEAAAQLAEPLHEDIYEEVCGTIRGASWAVYMESSGLESELIGRPTGDIDEVLVRTDRATLNKRFWERETTKAA